MKRTFLSIIMLMVVCFSLNAASLSSLTWANVCSGGMGADWYGSAESQKVADIVIAVQKNNGGWMKNDQLHQLSTSEYNALLNAKGEHSCLDNVATTQELRFLAKVYQGCKEGRNTDCQHIQCFYIKHCQAHQERCCGDRERRQDI